MKKLLFIPFLFLSVGLFAQPANDNCAGAQNLGTLGNPAPCGTATVSGTTSTVAGTLNGATPENPYVTQAPCTVGTMATPANDVWYMFTMPALGAQVNIVISGAGFTPNVAFWQGSCTGLVGRGCTVGTPGNATLIVPGMSAGQVYYIQVSGNTGQTGNFNLSVDAFHDCANCNEGSTLTVNPLPVNGQYSPGQTVSFCYHVSNYSQVNTNWLHGVQVTLGAGWNAASLVTTPAASCDGNGSWAYYPAGITASASGALWPAGFYYNSSLGGCSCVDANPGDNYGDNCSGAVAATTWVFCIQVTVAAGCNPGANLGVTFGTSGDGESGIWSNNGCASDPNTNFVAVQDCCPPNMSMTPVSCGGNGSATASAVIGGAGSQAPYVFAWTGPSGPVVTNTVAVGTTNTVNNLPAGTYTVVVTDKNNCSSTNIISVTGAASVITAPVTPTNITCTTNGSITTTNAAGGTAPYTYAWTGPGAYTSAVQSPTGLTTAGVYTLTVTDHIGCTFTTTATIVHTGAITVTVNSPTVCAGGAVTLTAAGATTYSWSTGATTNPITVTPGATSYTVVGTTGTCTNSAVATVGVTALPVVTVSSSTICPGNSATLNAAGATTYVWSTGATTPSITQSPGATTSYTVTGTTNTCTNSAVGTITIGGGITITANSATMCVGGTAALTATGATNYTWTPAATLSSGNGASVTATPATSTTYTITGASGACTGTTTANVMVNPLPVVTVTSTSVCAGSAGTIIASGANTYYWSTGATTAAITQSLGTTTSFTVTGTTNTCTNSAVGTITVTPNPTVTVNNPTICAGTTGTLTAAGGTTYSWTPAAGLSGTTGTSVTANPVVTSTYVVTGNTGGCMGTATAVVTIAPSLVVGVNSSTICAGTSAVLTATGGTTYSWTPAAGLSGTTGTSVTANPASTNTYVVTGNTGGCTGTATAVVTVNPNPIVTVTSTSVCSGNSGTITASGATTYSWNTGATTAAITEGPAGTTSYTVTGTTNNCTNTAVGTVTVVASVTVTVNDPIICLGSTTTVTATGATSYTWNTGATTPSIITTPATTTSFTVAGEQNGCTGISVGTVSVVSNPTVTVTSGTICLNGSVTLTAAGASHYTWTPATGLSSTTTNTVTANPTVTTTYTVVGAAGTCTTSGTAIVTVNPLPVLTVTSSTICVGQQIGTLNVTGANTYTWSGGGITGSNATNPTDNPLNTSIYTVNAMDINSCTATATGTITVNPVPTLTVASTSICSGFGPATLGVSGANTYTWTGGGITGSNSAAPIDNPAITTVYTVNGSNVQTCTATATGTITIMSTPTISVNSGAICFGQTTLVLNANSTATAFVWSPGIGISATSGNPVIANPLLTQTYTVIGSIGTCTASATATVTVHTPPVLTVTSSTICVGQETGTLSVGGASTYTWTGGSITGSNAASPTDSPVTTTIYTVNGIDVNTCTATAMGIITVNPLPIINATSGTVCVGQQTVNLTASGAVTYTWTPATGLMPTIGSIVTSSPPSTQNYVITGTDANGCFSVGTSSVLVNPLPVVIATSTIVCAGLPGTITASGANTYIWNTFTVGAALTQTPAATTNYTVAGTDVNGCINSAVGSITVNPLPLPIPTSNTPCANQTLDLTCAPNGLTSYNWVGPNTYSSSVQNPIITGVTASAVGVYTVYVIDGNGCVNSNMVTVIVNPLPLVTATGATVCVNQTINLTCTPAGDLYSWSNNSGVAFSNLQSPSIVATNTAMTGPYVVTVTDINTGCTSANAAVILVNPLPIVTTTSATICQGQQIATLTASGANIYNWVPNIGLSSAIGSVVTANPSSTQNYTITGTDINGCASTATTSVIVNPPPAVATNTISPDCIPLCPTFSVTSNPPAVSYNWSFTSGQPSTSTSIIAQTCFNSPGTFPIHLTVTDNQGCVGTASTTVTAFSIPIADFDYGQQPVTMLYPDVQFYNESTMGLPHYYWNFGDLFCSLANDTSVMINPSHLYSVADTFFVTLTVSTVSGCSASVKKPVIIHEYATLYVPNAFTPNGDGKNETFLAEGVGITDFKMYIFDRWGLLLYYSEDIAKGWNGTYQAKGDQVLQEDVYVWKIEAKDIQNTSRNLHGTVTLIK